MAGTQDYQNPLPLIPPKPSTPPTNFPREIVIRMLVSGKYRFIIRSLVNWAEAWGPFPPSKSQPSEDLAALHIGRAGDGYAEVGSAVPATWLAVTRTQPGSKGQGVCPPAKVTHSTLESTYHETEEVLGVEGSLLSGMSAG